MTTSTQELQKKNINTQKKNMKKGIGAKIAPHQPKKDKRQILQKINN